MDTETRPYQIGYILRGDLGDGKALETAGEIKKIIEDEKGIITQEGRPQKKELSFPIKKHNTGYFGFIAFIFSNEKIKDLKKSLEKIGVIRFLLSQFEQENQTKTRTYSKKPIKHLAAGKTISIIKGGEIDQKESLQVEEIDKKLEEILGQ